MIYDAQFLEGSSELLLSRMSRRRLLQVMGYSAAGVAGTAIIAACGGPNPPGPVNGTPVSTGTVTATLGTTHQITPYFLGYNNVPTHSPSWTVPGVVDAAKKLKPGTLRYPGGTVANYWDWRSGWLFPGAPMGNAPRTPYGLEELQIAVNATGAKPIYVLNMLTSDLPSQLQMLGKATNMGLPVELVELGNEFYLSLPKEYIAKFPTGRDYGAMATEWIKAIRDRFPNAKIAAVGGVPVSNPFSDPRKANWNQDLLQSLQGADVLTMHPYVSVPTAADAIDVPSLENTVSSRWQQFESEIQALPSNMRIWFTEYNFVDPQRKVFRSWADGVLAAEMSLNFLQENRIELICFYDMIGKTGNEVVFYNLQGQGSANSGLDQFALTAAGWSMSLLGDTIYGMTSAQQLSFGSTPAPLGWIFTNGTTRKAFIINSSSESFAWENISTISGMKQFQQLTSDPSQLITSTSTPTGSGGSLGSQLVLPAYSVTQLK